MVFLLELKSPLLPFFLSILDYTNSAKAAVSGGVGCVYISRT